jgi:hypothetical protein
MLKNCLIYNGILKVKLLLTELDADKDINIQIVELFYSLTFFNKSQSILHFIIYFFDTF